MSQLTKKKNSKMSHVGCFDALEVYNCFLLQKLYFVLESYLILNFDSDWQHCIVHHIVQYM